MMKKPVKVCHKMTKETKGNWRGKKEVSKFVKGQKWNKIRPKKLIFIVSPFLFIIARNREKPQQTFGQ